MRNCLLRIEETILFIQSQKPLKTTLIHESNKVNQTH